jgi:hypothetical protein
MTKSQARVLSARETKLFQKVEIFKTLKLEKNIVQKRNTFTYGNVIFSV